MVLGRRGSVISNLSGMGRGRAEQVAGRTKTGVWRCDYPGRSPREVRWFGWNSMTAGDCGGSPGRAGGSDVYICEILEFFSSNFEG